MRLPNGSAAMPRIAFVAASEFRNHPWPARILKMPFVADSKTGLNPMHGLAAIVLIPTAADPKQVTTLIEATSADHGSRRPKRRA